MPLLLLGAVAALAFVLLGRRTVTATPAQGGGAAPQGDGSAPGGSGSDITPQLVTQSKIWLQQVADAMNDPACTADPNAMVGPVAFCQAVPPYTPPSGAAIADPTEPAFVSALAAFQRYITLGQTKVGNQLLPVWQYIGLAAPLRLDGVLDIPTVAALHHGNAPPSSSSS